MLRPETTELETKYCGMMQNVKVDLVEDETKALPTLRAKEIPGVDLTR